MYIQALKQKRYLDVFKERLEKTGFSKPTFHLIEGAYENIPIDDKFDVILFSWTFIVEFNKEEQEQVLINTYKHLNEEGICLIDNPSRNQPYNQYGTYSPTKFYYDEWENIFTEIGFSHKVNIYTTKTGKERELIILKK